MKFITLSVGLLWLFIGSDGHDGKTYRAAVFEHEPLETATKTMLANAEVYAKQATIAANQGAKLIVFPEYGLTGFNYTDEEWDAKKSEIFVRLPKSADGWTPCTEPGQFFPNQSEHQEVFQLLSCVAKANSIFMLINALIIEPCNATEATCPPDGEFKYNTNLIFDKHGTLVARYHKYNLYGEDDLQQPPEPEIVIVEIDSVKFGTFICFDILFEKPAVEYVEKYGVRNLLFSTAWFNDLPFITSPQMYARFARGLGVNLLVSNMYGPLWTRLGSGLYSSQLGAIKETYDLATPDRLVIADLPVDPEPVPTKPFHCNISSDNQTIIRVPFSNNWTSIMTDIPSSEPVGNINKYWYQPLGNFSKLFLDKDKDDLTLCQGDLCCRLTYEKTGNDTLYALAVLNGLHLMLVDHHPYVQVCSLLRCETEDIETCGRVPENSTMTMFTKISLSGTFATSYVFPHVLGTDLQSIRPEDWSYSQGACVEDDTGFVSGAEIELESLPEEPIMVASLYGRVYERDVGH